MSDDRTNSTALVPMDGGRPFAVGDEVRVRVGVTDPDFPDFPFGGWTGTISDIDEFVRPPLYLVLWSDSTLEQIPTAYYVRCEREAMDSDGCWLAGTGLEVSSGPTTIEQPKLLCPLPLDLSRWDDRIRAIFHLSTDDPLPPHNEESIRQFHDHLSQRLSFPFAARSAVNDAQRLLMVRQLCPVEEAVLEDGILAEAKYGEEIEVIALADLVPLIEGVPSADLAAYSNWIEGQRRIKHLHPATFPGLNFILGRLLLLFILAGALLGALTATVESAWLAAQIGVALVGVVGGLIGANLEGLYHRAKQQPPGFILGAVLGLLGGGMFGASLAVAMMGYVGAIPGAILGNLLGRALSLCGVRNHRTMRLTLIGAYLGGHTNAFLLDSSEAVRGSVLGAVVGLGVFVAWYAIGGVLIRRWLVR